MRRSSPRPLAAALEGIAAQARPETLLARVQDVWPAVAGAVVAQEATPVSGTGPAVVVACSSAVWAQELEFMEPDLRGRLNEALGGLPTTPVASLRFRHARKP